MKKIIRNLGVHFELYIGAVFLSVTTLIVIMNVFTRYFLRFTFTWAEEIAVGCFVWTIFLGLANAYKTGGLIGVELLTNLVPEKGRPVIVFITSLIVSTISGTMFLFSFKYVMGSTKITAALELSYKYIYSSMVFSFALITLYSLYFLEQSFRKMVTGADIKFVVEDNLESDIVEEEQTTMSTNKESD
ncbi:TRAP transporter small permease [Oceanispirochaeta crateris]|uniref:TRAP transporter small permease n=1 Tax=Oceanispirochaeta crateris TaxID=2518645 RepID=A0A5C1QLE2_9SPIO|nr:TRAP transporter small permease [Oceanispirochaeta crateris]QEN08985.1 TRAP transporter small permease [Oceanispirochaeta crateris]